MDDDELLSLLADSFGDIGATPAAALDVAHAAIGMRALDGLLAELVFDSWREDQVAATRSATTDTRLLSFATDELTLDLELRDDGAVILGHVAPAGVRRVALQGRDGDVTSVDTDEHGRFRVVTPGGPVRVRLGQQFVTPWITR